ncbi:tetratricopeptide repeat protein [Actinoplanes sp. NPDC023936]|uniref:tetratricopeptide repeat protein n=1 Tax=Actinoplanes sp. NPDC023936 TaxID=3154910 RepID=UPI00340AF4D1
MTRRRWGSSPDAGQTVTGSVVFGDIIMIAGAGGDVTISRDRPPYRVVPADHTPVPLPAARARSQPSRLLLARHQIVPFSGRERTLDGLAEWAGGDDPVSALLVHGAGGQGKTRLATEVGIQCAAAGWTVWQIAHAPAAIPVSGADASRVDLPGGALLAVVDYADRWPFSALLALITHLHGLHSRTGARVRVLLLARSDGYWWPALADRVDSDLGVPADQLALPALAADSSDDRLALFSTAANRFAAALDLEHPPATWPAPDLATDAFGQVLAVHMSALATVDATRHGQVPPTRQGAVSAYLLRREQGYWQHLHTRAEAPITTAPEMMHRTVVAATLLGAQPRHDARQALHRAGIADSGPLADRVIDDHLACYPPAGASTVLEPLHPDRLGEDLLALSTPGRDGEDSRLARDWTREIITGLLTATAAPAVGASGAITVLVEAARRWPHLATGVLYPMIREQPGLVMAAGGATLTRLAGIPGIDPGILEALDPLLPAERHLDLDIAAAAISSVLVGHHLARTTDLAEQARLHASHARRLDHAGQGKQALVPAEEAVRLRRRLAETDPAAHLSDLAASLTHLGLIQSGLGRRDVALPLAEEAVGIRRRLAETDPENQLPDLARSLNNLCSRLAELGRYEQSLPLAEEAVRIRRRLAGSDPGTHLRDLGVSVYNLSLILNLLGRREEALTLAEESLAIDRRLAAANPDAHLHDLAASLNSLCMRLWQSGRRDRAVAPAEEAVSIRRRLAAANPDAHLPGLAASLTNLAAIRSGSGRGVEGLELSEEAAGICRRLVDANPDAHLPDLARSLNRLGLYRWEQGRREQAPAPAEEAVKIYRRLAAETPDAYLSDFAASLHNFAMILAQLGRPEQGLALAEEAERIRRGLAAANPDAHLRDLASSLHNLSHHQAAVGRPDLALASAEEAVLLRRGLAEANPDAHLPDLAVSLDSLGNWRARSGEPEHALVVSDEAVRIHRGLAAANPQVYLPRLAAGLSNHGRHLAETGRRETGLTAADEAAAILRPLAAAQPDVHLPGLAEALTTLGTIQAGLTRTEPALAATAEAVSIRRRLAATNPDAHRSDYATSLLAYARACASLGTDLRQALESVTEAIGILDELARELPQRYDEELRSAHLTRAAILDGLGRAQEAAELRRHLEQPASGPPT